MPPNLLQTFCPEKIPAAISTFRSDQEVPVLNEQHFDGGQCRIFKVDFSDGASWSVRIPIHVKSDSQDTIVGVLQGEREVLEEIGGIGLPWVPKHYGSSLTFGNVVGFPFMALSWFEGSPLLWTTTEPPRPVRNKVLHQIAKIQLTLIEYTKDYSMFSTLLQVRISLTIIGGTATEYFSRLSRNKLHRIRNGQLRDITEQDCSKQESLLRQVLYPELEDAPFALDHGDLAPLNIIVDSEHNVTG
jgi:hypothetical protein